MLSRKLLLIPAVLVSISGCSFGLGKVCEDEVANLKSQLLQTQALAQHEREELLKQRSQIQAVKDFTVKNSLSPRQNEITQAQQEKIQEAMRNLEQKRSELERERFEINRMRQLSQMTTSQMTTDDE